jgi:exopolyphosphatase/pppGpp-phosphohydrolase
MSTRTLKAPGETGILARVLGNGRGKMSSALARHILTLGFDNDDQNRMADLAERNQVGGLSPHEHAELMEFVRAGHVLALLHSRARQALKSLSKA